MPKTIVKLICYLELEHGEGIDQRKVNLKVRELLDEDWSNFFNEVRVKPSVLRTLQNDFKSPFKGKFIPEPLLMKQLANISSDTNEK